MREFGERGNAENVGEARKKFNLLPKPTHVSFVFFKIEPILFKQSMF